MERRQPVGSVSMPVSFIMSVSTIRDADRLQAIALFIANGEYHISIPVIIVVISQSEPPSAVQFESNVCNKYNQHRESRRREELTLIRVAIIHQSPLLLLQIRLRGSTEGRSVSLPETEPSASDWGFRS